MCEVIAVCISEKKGTVKKAVSHAHLLVDHGVCGDAHADGGHRQLSLLATESVDALRHIMPEIAPGAFAENILTKGIALHTLPVGTKLRVGEAEIQITQIGKECHAACEIRRQTGDCVMPREGVFAHILRGGQIQAGDSVEIQSERRV